jgi:D-alanine-D-alanine ligase
MPVIVKPVNLGSSVGVSKATDQASFEAAIEETFKYDNEVLIEEFIEGREFEIAVLGNEDPKATVPGEVIVSEDYEFYDFHAKYVDADGASTVIPADIPESIVETVKEETLKAYKALNCCDYARVDFFLDSENNIYINEINTIPGFTNISMFPKLWEYEGINNQSLIDKLISLCLKRHNVRNRIITDFDSELK